jgi:uncharacterized protein YndB with AHSA1/START domain
MPIPDVTLSRTIRVSREVVYDAWLDPQSLARFMCPAPGTWVGRVDVDPVVGGAFEIVMVVGDSEIPHTGVYRALERPSRLSFTWMSPMAGDGSLVDVALEAVDDSTTELTLIHRGLPNETSRVNHEGGWTHILETLADTLTPNPGELVPCVVSSNP